jgi:trehalose utilization protein
MIRVTIFNEFYHERENERVRALYPNGIHETLRAGLEDDEVVVRTVTLEDADCGLTAEVLAQTDVLIWWGHVRHHLVPDEVADRVRDAVLGGMGAIFLHSAHHSKPFKRLMGTSCNLSWRVDGDRELLWAVNPTHPIARGMDRFILLEQEETYSEPFGIPEPQELVFVANFEGGEVFRAGCCYRRENGKIFYFQPGHETYPTYHHADVLQVLKNAVRWATPEARVELVCPHVSKPLA